MACGLKPAFANNITVENVALVDQDADANTYDIQFDISWENSWRTAITPSTTDNWDAAWVFAKYSTYSGGSWSSWAHCTVSSAGAQTPTMDFASNKGVFIYRPDVTTAGRNNWDDVEIRWSYGTAFADDAIVKVKVFAIEMVYIPEGTLFLNTAVSGNMYNEIFNDGSLTQIANEDALGEGAIRWKEDNVYGGTGNVGGTSGTSYGSDALGASYPKGFAAFYVMKYEISQGQYAAFLNTLTAGQDTTRSIQGETDYTTYRGTISGSQGSRTASSPERACNFLKWADITAYADWAALRPMTELEFEKACRGGQSVVTDEFAWGTAVYASLAYTLENTGANNEGIATNYSTTKGNLSYATTDGDINGPLRCGIFAANASNTGRMTSGAGYYGVMELSGNLWERCVTIADKDHNGATTSAGLFNGGHGNGSLDASGNADELTWPGTNAVGGGLRGGRWYGGATGARVSDRSNAGYTYSYRSGHYGGRCARTSP